MNKILKLVYHDTQNFISYHNMKFTIVTHDILSHITNSEFMLQDEFTHSYYNSIIIIAAIGSWLRIAIFEGVLQYSYIPVLPQYTGSYFLIQAK